MMTPEKPYLVLFLLKFLIRIKEFVLLFSRIWVFSPEVNRVVGI